ncbi:TRI39 ligase, partial [Atractosteus spatula]|nr:TRI39 ligase [Atractosteus spatula]
MGCIGGYWDSSDACQCPLCKKTFPVRPDLSINTFIAGMAEQEKVRAVGAGVGTCDHPPSSTECRSGTSRLRLHDARVLSAEQTGALLSNKPVLLLCWGSPGGQPVNDIQYIMLRHALTLQVEPGSELHTEVSEAAALQSTPDDSPCPLWSCAADPAVSAGRPRSALSGAEPEREEDSCYIYTVENRGTLSEEQFQCSICLDVFIDPVSTPCGHSFCMACIRGYWNHSKMCQCPMCKKTFPVRPELSVNRVLAEIAEQLVSPIYRLEEKLCKKHEKLLEGYCRTDQACVCALCVESGHKKHNVVPVEREWKKKLVGSPVDGQWRPKSSALFLISNTVRWTSSKRKLLAFQCWLMSEQQIRCPVCLDTNFTNPVTIPCGHSFCMACIGEYWNHTDECLCPLCKTSYPTKPDLLANRSLGESAGRFDETKEVSGDEERFAKPGEVPCDSCTGRKLQAVKSCLVCLASYCETHTLPHYQEAAFKKHTLIAVSKNLEDKVCKQHGRPLERFCRSDQTCICVKCTETDHRTHSTLSAHKEWKRKKVQVEKTANKVEQMTKERLKKVEELNQLVKLSKVKREIEDSVQVFATLLRSVERSQAEIVELIGEKQRAEEKMVEGLITELEQEIAELQKRSTELEQLSHTEDPIHFLQVGSHSLNRLIFHLGMDSPSDEEGDFPSGTGMPQIVDESHLKCSICLDVFDKPVSTLCGHNFCQKCLQQHLFYRDECPLCKTFLLTRPDLHINTTLSEIAERKSANRIPENGFARPEDVACDVCRGRKQKADKSCLVCLTSYCRAHLRPHSTVKRLTKHKLVVPVRDLEDRMCADHERPLDLFCRDEQVCICVRCIDVSHKTHECVSAETECRKRKAELGVTQGKMEQMIKDRQEKVDEIKELIDLSKTSTNKEMEDIKEVFQAVICAVQKAQDDIIKPMEEKQKEVEGEAEGLIKELEEEITELRKRISGLEELSSNEDHIHFLQNIPALQPPPKSKDWSDITVDTDLCLGTVRTPVSELLESINKELEKLSAIGRYGWPSDSAVVRSFDALPVELQSNVCFSADDVTLDSSTAHPNLVLSEDGREVRDGDKRQDFPDSPQRYDLFGSVLGAEGFSAGRHYWEVEVEEKSGWDLGVARESVNRKGNITLNPESGYWAVILWNGNQYCALTDPLTLLSVTPKPQKVGVYVDYEEGQVSFYNVEAKSHIYTFTDTFTEKLYPYFSPHLQQNGQNTAPLVISHVKIHKK